ncbi:MAG: HlyD family efflux transporter periplasmic adaptor subunit [Candidatus Udaeobacter sp.]
MDIARPSNARAKLIRRIILGGVAVLFIGGVSFGLTRLRPAAPAVDRATVWSDEVKRGPMLRDVRGLGTLVPEDIRWIPAQTDSRVDRWVLRPGATVKPGSVIMELSDPTLQREALDAEFQLKGAEADLANLKVQVDSDLMNQKAVEAGVRSDYEQAKIQHEVDAKLVAEGLAADVTERLSRVKEQQLAIRVQLEGERTKVAVDSAKARLAAQQAKIDEQNALFQLKKSQVDALHVRAGIDGVLQLVPVEVGQHVTPGTNLARVADPKKLKAEIKIAETQAKDVIIGQTATVDTRNGVVTGHVSRVDPSVQNGTVTVDVQFDGLLPDGARPDLSVDGTVELENLKNVLYVGRPVHGASQSTISLFRLTPDGSEAVRTNVKLGRSSVNTVEILDGLQVGDRVILSDMSQWDNYDRIRLH